MASMDSGNSGSMQSSSGGGGDEEYDSRAESFSAFLNSSGQISGPMLTAPPPPPPSQHHTHHTFLFDPLSNYLDAFPRSPLPPPTVNSLPNLDVAWARGPRSEPNCTTMGGGGLMGSSSSPTAPITVPPQPSNRIPYNMMPLHSGSSDASASASADQPIPTRNPKKRSRASRRAPTTVLTTDTSNFRAMVQEFTGIPAPPFSASSSFPRARLDLFSNASSMRMSLSDPPSSPYLLRPFVQKVPPPSFSSLPFSSPSSTSLSSPSTANMVDVAASTATATANSNTSNSISAFANTTATSSNTPSPSTNAVPTNNYHLLSDLALPKQNQNLLNMNDPIFTFQSQSPKYPPPNLPAFGSKSIGALPISSSSSMTDSQLRMGMLDGYSMNQGHASAHQGGPISSLIRTSGGMSSRSEDTPRWGDGASDGDQTHLRPFNGNYSNPQRVSSCKLNYNASSSDFHAEKSGENVPSRGEGMVDSWICSSD